MNNFIAICFSTITNNRTDCWKNPDFRIRKLQFVKPFDDSWIQNKMTAEFYRNSYKSPNNLINHSVHSKTKLQNHTDSDIHMDFTNPDSRRLSLICAKMRSSADWGFAVRGITVGLLLPPRVHEFFAKSLSSPAQRTASQVAAGRLAARSQCSQAETRAKQVETSQFSNLFGFGEFCSEANDRIREYFNRK